MNNYSLIEELVLVNRGSQSSAFLSSIAGKFADINKTIGSGDQNATVEFKTYTKKTDTKSSNSSHKQAVNIVSYDYAVNNAVSINFNPEFVPRDSYVHFIEVQVMISLSEPSVVKALNDNFNDAGLAELNLYIYSGTTKDYLLYAVKFIHVALDSFIIKDNYISLIFFATKLTLNSQQKNSVYTCKHIEPLPCLKPPITVNL